MAGALLSHQTVQRPWQPASRLSHHRRWERLHPLRLSEYRCAEKNSRFTHTKLFMEQLVTSQRTMTYCLKDEPNCCLDFLLYKVAQGQSYNTIISSHVSLLQGLLDPLMVSYQQVLYRVHDSLPGSLQQLRLRRQIRPRHPAHNRFPQLRRALEERRPSV